MNSLKSLLNKKDKIVNNAEVIICRKIQRYCKRYKRTVKTVYGVSVLDKDGIEIVQNEHTPPEKWIYYFEKNFGPFGLYMCKNGKWIEGQTPLIVFKKPNLRLNKDLKY